MRIGLSSPLQHSNAKEWAARMKELGCGAVVFPLDYTAHENDIADYVDAARNAGLVIAEVGIWKNVFAIVPKEREEARERARRQLKLADEIGALCCVNVAGTYGGPVWDGGYRENFSADYWNQLVSYTRELIDEVHPTRTKYSIEPMPWMYPTGPQEYRKLVEDVDRDAMGVHMDIINMINTPQRYFFPEEFLEECFDILGEQILSCHLKDIRLRQELTFQLEETACGKGSFPIERYIEKINEVNPDMPVIIEHLTTDEEYISSLAYVQKRMTESEKMR